MSPVHIVGLGIDQGELPVEISRRVYRAEVLVGGSRLLARFEDHSGVKIPVKGPLADVLGTIRQEMDQGREVVVLADGDPLFFGIGKRLIDSLGGDNVIVYPNVTTLQAAAARIRIPWENVRTVSLHGRRDIWPLLRALVFCDAVAVYTDREFGPARIAEELLRRDVDTFRMAVFENLGQEGECFREVELSRAREMDFSPLNFVLLQRVKQPDIPLRLGIEDDLYVHEKGLITKKEVRVVGLAQLQIGPHHTVWDLGAGCGSVAIEASILARGGMVLAVEKMPQRVRLIKENLKRTGAYVVEAICGEMPRCLESLPDPDRIFIGGGMGRGNGILETAARRLKPGGRMVVHLVLVGSLLRTKDYLHTLKWPFSITQIQVSRSKDITGDHRLEALNPVFIIRTTKPSF